MTENAIEVTDQSTGDAPVSFDQQLDKELRATWDKINSPERLEKEFQANPPMPTMPDSASPHDVDRAILEWQKSPLKDRQAIASAHRDLGQLKEAAEALGIKVETAADIKALQDRLNGDSQGSDKDALASLDVLKGAFPDTKHHKEAAAALSEWTKRITADPIKGWRELIEAQGLNIVQLLRADELHRLGLPQQSDKAAPVQAEADPEVGRVESLMAELGGADETTMAEMANLITAGEVKQRRGERQETFLARVRQAALNKIHHGGGKPLSVQQSMTAQLREIADRAYGGAA